MSVTTMENNMCTATVYNNRGEVIASYNYEADKYISTTFDWVTYKTFDNLEGCGSIQLNDENITEEERRKVNNAIEEIDV